MTKARSRFGLGLFATGLLALVTLGGCEDSQTKTGDMVKPDEAEKARQQEMAEFYKKNPLTPKKQK